jgi:hypothetical protein
MSGARQLIVLSFVILRCLTSWAQDRPIDVTISDISLHALRFDGHLVRVRALLAFGWEGDNFLYDLNPRVAIPRIDAPSMWFYCRPERERQVYAVIAPQGRVLATFTGYFHFVPKTDIKNGAFDPGPLQFEAVRVSRPTLDSTLSIFDSALVN